MRTDSHCHLNQYQDPASVIARARAAGVGRVFGVPETLQDCLELKKLASQHEEVYYFVGVHPQKVTSDLPSEEELQATGLLLNEKNPKLVGLGEIGLDYKYGNTPELQERQKEAFNHFLELAEARNLAVNVHSRLAELDVLSILEGYSLKKVILHWFQGPKELIKAGVEKGYYFSIGPSILNSKNYENRALEIGLDRLLTETDGPVNFNGRQAEPSWIPEIGRKLSETFKQPLDEIEKRLEANLDRLLKV